MSKWKMVKLKDAFELQMGKTPSRNNSTYWNDGANKWVSIGDIGLTDKFIYYTKETISDFGVTESGIKVVPKDTVIMSFKLSIGKACIVSEDMYTNEAIMAFIDNNIYEIDNVFLYYVLKSIDWSIGTNKAVMGSTLNKSTLGEFEIPLPPLETQKQIAKNLDTASELLAMRKQQLAEMDNLIKSIFYDMFGDPVTNENEWEIKKLKDVCFKITDGTHDTPKRVSDGVLFITGKNIRPFTIDLSDIEYISQEDHEIIYKRCNPQLGDILYTNIGVNYGTAAKCTLDFEFSMKNVALLKIDRKIVNSIYVECMLNYLRNNIVSQNQTGGAQTFMGLATINNIRIPIPKLGLQSEFSTIVTEIEAQKSPVKKAIDETQLLFDSLMSQYFDEES